MNTDPLKKLQHILKYCPNKFSHKLTKEPSSDSEIEINLDQQKDEGEFIIANNPILKRASRKIIRTFSFEKKITSQNSINE